MFTIISRYKARYENKQAGEDLSDGEDGGSLGSETPSELLDEMEEQISESEVSVKSVSGVDADEVV